MPRYSKTLSASRFVACVHLVSRGSGSESMEAMAGGRIVAARWWSRWGLHLTSRSPTPASPLCQCRVLQFPPRSQGALWRKADRRPEAHLFGCRCAFS